jgi:hypothetical protein
LHNSYILIGDVPFIVKTLDGLAELPNGNGVLLWFRIDDFAAAVSRAQAMSAEILEGPMVNPNANHREIWIRDPDGYVVVLASAPD